MDRVPRTRADPAQRLGRRGGTSHGSMAWHTSVRSRCECSGDGFGRSRTPRWARLRRCGAWLVHLLDCSQAENSVRTPLCMPMSTDGRPGSAAQRACGGMPHVRAALAPATASGGTDRGPRRLPPGGRRTPLTFQLPALDLEPRTVEGVRHDRSSPGGQDRSAGCQFSFEARSSLA